MCFGGRPELSLEISCGTTLAWFSYVQLLLQPDWHLNYYIHAIGLSCCNISQLLLSLVVSNKLLRIDLALNTLQEATSPRSDTSDVGLNSSRLVLLAPWLLE